MMKAALTGSIASGKSEVLKIFKEHGITVIDSDQIVSRLYTRPDVKKTLFEIFRTLERKEIAKQAFSEPQKKASLEAILHPLVIAEIKKRFFELEAANTKLVVVEVQLLFEAGLQKMFDKVIVVNAEQKNLLSRLVEKGYSRDGALLRINSQIPSEQKVKKADFVIDNNAGLPALKKEAEKLLVKLNV